MSNYPHPIIAREGWLFVAIALVVALLLTVGQYWILAVLAWLAALFVLQFFRDPPRVVPSQANLPAPDKILIFYVGRLTLDGVLLFAGHLMLRQRAIYSRFAYALMGGTVAPGFDFADFELADRAMLAAGWPAQRALIEALT